MIIGNAYSQCLSAMFTRNDDHCLSLCVDTGVYPYGMACHCDHLDAAYTPTAWPVIVTTLLHSYIALN
jgi:hypothetical protein